MARFNLGIYRFIRRTIFASALSGATVLAVMGCTGQPEIREVEVTREVSVTHEVPVTVEVEKAVEVTREVPVVQEVLVTVTVPQTVEATREVETLQTVEVTREVPITRIVAATPTPTLGGASTISPNSPTPGPTATPTPAVSAIPTPTPSPSSRFLSWEMEREYYNERNIFRFWNTALGYRTEGQAPMLTYWCDNRSGRGMYINWHYPITATSSNIPSSSRDPFSPHRDIPLYALLEYADDLLQFVDDLRLSDREQRELDEIWDQVRDRWFVGQGTPAALADDPTPDDLVALLDERTHRSVDIDLDFFQEIVNPDNPPRHRAPSLATITGTWLLISGRTQIYEAGWGNCEPPYGAFTPLSLIPETRNR